MKTFFTERKEVWGGKSFFVIFLSSLNMYLSFTIDSVIMVNVLLDIYCLRFAESLGYVSFWLLENPITLFL